MDSTVLAVIGVAAGLVNIAALVPYLRDIFRGNTKPERATWWVWLALSLTSFVAQVVSGAEWSLVFGATSLAAVGFIAFLSLKYGYGRFHKRDTVALVFTAFGIAVSFILKDPLLAVLAVILVDFSGGWLTLYKTWQAPHTENLAAWVISTFGGFLAILAVGDYKPAIYLPPLSVSIYNLLLIIVIVHRRGKVTSEPRDL